MKNDFFIAIIISLIFLSSCASVNMNTPKCLDKGENKIGAYGLYLADPSSSNDGEAKETGIGSFYLTYSRGLGKQNEIGLGTGAFGGDLYFKHGFFSKDSSFKFAGLANVGYLYWIFPESSLGAVSGYQFKDNFLIYGGYRHHYIFGSSDDIENNFFGHVIGGIELFPDSSFSILFEYNRTLNEIKIRDLDFDESVYLDMFGFGFNFKL
ncbi:MAG: hypothetical protein FXF47_01740 [Candidatus Mcinerneyibacterium aminivorans]|uniref:Outer membrane beta-barrel protein n=1 Tax=Candidatus Mcinerneyibacterium aminivorans TaxID=2703815 RepID=A0A5D0ML02_9BACT|nr:MAG: hypothetical protein FXF47_01740 [Candidatus Mcinerneyibacterium aminivorans]